MRAAVTAASATGLIEIDAASAVFAVTDAGGSGREIFRATGTVRLFARVNGTGTADAFPILLEMFHSHLRLDDGAAPEPILTIYLRAAVADILGGAAWSPSSPRTADILKLAEALYSSASVRLPKRSTRMFGM
jgi:hypothetical protein